MSNTQIAYAFKVEIIGHGECLKECWDNAVEQFSLEPGPPEVDHRRLCPECLILFDECQCHDDEPEDLAAKADRLYEERRDNER